MLNTSELQSLRNMGNEAEAAADEIERMQAWIEGDCICPCCSETRECVDGCTFASDCPEHAERMAGAREALYGG